MVDSTREMRAMVLASLPYPPLPIEVERVEEDSMMASGGVDTTSHTLISQCLNSAMLRNNQESNERRRIKTQQILHEFLFALASEGFEGDCDVLYRIYCDFTRRHISAYLEKDADVRFKPLSSVCRGDPIHNKMCEYMAAQDILFESKNKLTRKELATHEYASLLLMARNRWGHAATKDELEAIERDKVQIFGDN